MHAPYPHHVLPKKNQRFSRFIDTAIYGVVIFGVIANIPQLLAVWNTAELSGISLTSWICFLILSVFWFIYGLIHSIKPIVVGNFFLIIIQSLIILGIVSHY